MGKPLCFFLLDLSVVFDTIDHSILLHRLAHSFGLTGSAFTWVQSYLTGRSQVVRIGSHSSNLSSCLADVPQGSVLGPLLFSIPLQLLTLHKPMASNNNSTPMIHNSKLPCLQIGLAWSSLESCLESLQAWFCANSMTL